MKKYRLAKGSRKGAYIIRSKKEKFEKILTGKENIMIVNNSCLPGELIRFVEVDETGQRTGNEAMCEIVRMLRQSFPKPQDRFVIVFKKVSEKHGANQKAQKSKAAR